MTKKDYKLILPFLLLLACPPKDGPKDMTPVDMHTSPDMVLFCQERLNCGTNEDCDIKNDAGTSVCKGQCIGGYCVWD